MTQTTYVCPFCENAVQRSFRAPSVVRSCENGCGFDHFVREDLLSKLRSVPEEDRPDDWGEMSAEERVMVALREGSVTVDDLR